LERFNLRKLNELEVRKQYQTEISSRFANLEYLNDGHFINRAWENIKENIKTTTVLGAVGWSAPSYVCRVQPTSDMCLIG
jgi:hypothetical protein